MAPAGAAWPPLLMVMMMVMMVVGHGAVGGLGQPRGRAWRYEAVVPRRLPAARRGTRHLSTRANLYPDRVLYSIRAEGKDYVLHLEKNTQLLGQRYTETHYSADGTEIIEKPDIQDHCFYQGRVQGYATSAASISTCRGLSGFFRVNETTYVLEPLGEDGAGWHAVYRAAHLRAKRGTCKESGAALEYDHEPEIAAAMKLHRWKSTPLHKGPRYVELVLVVDNEEFRRYKDLRTVQNRMKEIVNHVDKLYQSLHLRVALIGLEVWNHKDKIMVSTNPEVTLDNFLRWRETELLKKKKHDNAQLITGVDFHGTTVGLAKKLAMCTRDSGGVSQDHSENAVGAASTMAHEMGHNLGMSHDEDVASCRCPVPKADGGCVMAASVGLVYPKLFSSCSEHDMWQFLGDPRTSCLLNAPEADELYGGPVCGNQFVERGEQCDCGTPEECSDPCCNATSCRLREGAECAHGACCQGCKVKAAGAVCRASKNDCDLPERCSGLGPECPEDAFQENGVPCQHGQGYCYNGACPSHAEQCRTLWGAAAQVAPDTCFNYNSKQNLYLHCLTESGKRPCSPRDVKCGTLLCLSENTRPVAGGGSYHISLNRLKCRAAAAENDGNGMVTNLQLVPTGTKCGEEMVCYAGRCQDVLVYGSKNCSAKCNGHGVCNHKRECHCEPGWAAPYCEHQVVELGTGSSLVAVAAVLAVLALAGVLLGGGFVLLRGAGRRRFRKGQLRGDAARGLANPLFREGGREWPVPGDLSRCDIGSPRLLATTSNLEGAHAVRPGRPAPQPPAPATQRTSPAALPRPPQGVAMLCLPPLPPAPVKSPLAPREQARPSPPSKPLPALKSREAAWPSRTTGEAPRPPPVPPAKPTALLGQQRSGPTVPQSGVTPKVAMKPPTSRP